MAVRYNSIHDLPDGPTKDRLLAEQNDRLKVVAEQGKKRAQETAEDELQDACETLLHRLGFWPRDDKHLDGSMPPRGWYYHHHDARRNGYLLDLLIWTHKAHMIEVELKVKGGRLRKNQLLIMQASPETTRLAWSYEEFAEILHDWLNETE